MVRPLCGVSVGAVFLESFIEEYFNGEFDGYTIDHEDAAGVLNANVGYNFSATENFILGVEATVSATNAGSTEFYDLNGESDNTFLTFW